MLKTKQAELWSGPFGDLYNDRNKVSEEDVQNRLNFWDRTLKQLTIQSNKLPESFLEVGAGQGANLQAIQKIYHIIEKPVDLWATEVNDKAKLKLNEINNIRLVDDIKTMPQVDVVFTMGVLIHVHPAHLNFMLREMYNASRRWIICCEYFAPTTRALSYHGENDALWLDDYGSKWLDLFPLRVVGYGFLWKRLSGLDNLTFWMMEKTS